MEIYIGNICARFACAVERNLYAGNMSGPIRATTAPEGGPRRAYHHGNLKAALVEAGVAILEEGGMPALSLRAIAARVGVSHTAPKNHFGSLRGLLTAIAAEGFRRHAAFMRTGVSEASGRKERLRAAMEGYVRFAREHRALFLLMFSAEHCDFADPDLRAAADGSYAVLSDIATGLDWDRGAGPGGRRRTEIMLWSLAHGYAQLSNAGLVAPPRDEAGNAGAPLDVASVMPDFDYGPEPIGDVAEP